MSSRKKGKPKWATKVKSAVRTRPKICDKCPLWYEGIIRDAMTKEIEKKIVCERCFQQAGGKVSHGFHTPVESGSIPESAPKQFAPVV